MSGARLVIATTVTIVFLKLLMLIPLMMTADVLKNYALLLFFIPDGVLIGLFWVPLMVNFARRIHIDPAYVLGAMTALYSLTVLNAAIAAPLYLAAPASISRDLALYSTGALAVADLVLASLLLPVKHYAEKH